jgi:hypothetical protein
MLQVGGDDVAGPLKGSGLRVELGKCSGSTERELGAGAVPGPAGPGVSSGVPGSAGPCFSSAGPCFSSAVPGPASTGL